MGREFLLEVWLDDEKYCDGCPCLDDRRDRCKADSLRLTEVKVTRLGRITGEMFVVRPGECPLVDRSKYVAK
jgi:hypothetical protein